MKASIWLIYERDTARIIANEDTNRDYVGEGFAFIIVSFPGFLPVLILLIYYYVFIYT